MTTDFSNFMFATSPVLQIRMGNRNNLGIISHISKKKTYFVTHHVLMKGHNICFC